MDLYAIAQNMCSIKVITQRQDAGGGGDHSHPRTTLGLLGLPSALLLVQTQA